MRCSSARNMSAVISRTFASSSPDSVIWPASTASSRLWTIFTVAATPTSAYMSVSSNFSQTSSSKRSRSIDASCCPRALRLLESPSRTPLSHPFFSAAPSAADSVTSASTDTPMNTSDQSYDKRLHLPSLPLPCFPFGCKPPGKQVRCSILAHCNPVQRRGYFHGATLMRDDDELGLILILPDDRQESPQIRVVQRGFYLIQDVEGARMRQEEREEKGNSGQRLLPS